MAASSHLPDPNLVCFADRTEAGEKLAQAVVQEIEHDPPPTGSRYVVYALPRGGLPVAEPLARQLVCPLSVVVAKKITSPDNSELAIGAVAADGKVVWMNYRQTPQAIALRETALEQAQTKAQAQFAQFAPFCSPSSPTGAIALVVDDGIATGMTIAAAVQSLRAQQAAQVWICAPVAPLELLPFLKSLGDRVILLATPSPFYSVSRFYERFPQVSMEEALESLQRSRL